MSSDTVPTDLSMAGASVADANPRRSSRRAWLGLAVLALPTLLVALDVFIMVLAVPHVSAALGATSTQQLWIMDIYGFMVAGLMITMGTLGDRIGRRRLLLIGATAFGVASALAAWAPTPELLIAARALLGIAGATLAPSTLSLIATLFPDSAQRTKAIATWAGCFVAGAILGPIVGGVMLQHFWWGSVFLLGVPAMVLLLVLGPILLPEYRDPTAGRLDPASVGLLLVAMLSAVYGLKDIAREGWHVTPVAAIAVGLVAGQAFVRRQRRLTHPLIDVRLFSRPAFSTTLGAMMAFTATGGTMLYVAQYLQLVEGLAPVRAALAMMPGMVAAIIGMQLAPALGRRVPHHVLFPAGLAISVCGMLLLTQDGLPFIVASGVITSLGGSPLVALGTGLIISSVPGEKAGSASGIAQTGNDLGYALGIAVLGSIGTAVYRSVTAGTAAGTGAAHDSLAGAVETAQTLPDETASAMLAAARDAYMSGMHVVAVAAAAATIVIGVLLYRNLRSD